jgi:hypothetical protein
LSNNSSKNRVPKRAKAAAVLLARWFVVLTNCWLMRFICCGRSFFLIINCSNAQVPPMKPKSALAATATAAAAAWQMMDWLFLCSVYVWIWDVVFVFLFIFVPSSKEMKNK